MSEWLFLNDGIPETSIDRSLATELDSAGLLFSYIENKSRSIRFSGFWYTGERWIVVFPKTMKISGDLNENLDSAALLYKVLLKYSRSGLDRITRSQESLLERIDDEKNLSSLSMYDFLLEDWRRFGTYKNFRKRIVASTSGQINWKRTFSRIEPLIDDSGFPVYNTFITSKNDYEVLERISLLQKWAVATADNMLGWLLTANHKERLLYPELKDYAGECPLNRQTAIGIIKSELSVQYDIRKIHLLRIILALVEGTHFTVQHGMKIQLGVKNFWPVWENMCKFLLSDESTEHSKYLPFPVYLREDKTRYTSRDTSLQRPDIVFSHGKSLSVVDAKYYNVTQNLPGWGDIVKQLFYEKSFKAIDHDREIKNYFLFPLPTDSDTPAEVNMQFDSRTMIDQNILYDEFAKITCKYYSMHKACSHYISNKPDREYKQSLLC